MANPEVVFQAATDYADAYKAYQSAVAEESKADGEVNRAIVGRAGKRVAVTTALASVHAALAGLVSAVT